MELEQLTILILARERHRHLLKTIRYYEKTKINILILHKSDKPLRAENFNKNIVYLNTNSSYSERCSLAITKIKTSFCILSCDDELYLPSTLQNMIKTLTSNKRVKSVGAQAIATFKYGPMTCGNLPYRYLYKYENLSQDLETRVKKHYKVHGNQVAFGAMYRMYRTKDFKMLLGILGSNKDVTTPYITEITAEIFSLYGGGVVYLNELLWIRNWNVKQVNASDWDRSLTFSQWWSDPRYSKEKRNWIRRMSNLIGFKDQEFIMAHFLKNRELEDKRETKRPKWKYVDSHVKFLVRRLFNPASLPLPLIKVLPELDKHQVKYAKIEFEQAVKSILS